MKPFDHLRGLRGWDLVVTMLFEPVALALLPFRALFWVTDRIRSWWWTS